MKSHRLWIIFLIIYMKCSSVTLALPNCEDNCVLSDPANSTEWICEDDCGKIISPSEKDVVFHYTLTGDFVVLRINAFSGLSTTRCYIEFPDGRKLGSGSNKPTINEKYLYTSFIFTASKTCSWEFTYAKYPLDIISFDDFSSTFYKIYKDEAEAIKRKNIFQDNVQIMEDHNRLYELGKSSFKMGVNEYSDMTYDEVISVLTGDIEPNLSVLSSQNKRVDEYIPIDIGNEPQSMDYRDMGIFNPIRNQGACGSCWAFSAVGSIESHISLTNGNKVQLSEQYLVDCSKGYAWWGNTGCDGGSQSGAIDYVESNGIALKDTYPYTAAGGTCNKEAPKTAHKVVGKKHIKRFSDADLLNAIVHAGPISVPYMVSYNFQNYKKGILVDDLCSNMSQTNHAVVLMGYGSENGQDYWLIRNSWGETWGEKGYGRLGRNVETDCQLSSGAYFPIIEGTSDITIAKVIDSSDPNGEGGEAENAIDGDSGTIWNPFIPDGQDYNKWYITFELAERSTVMSANLLNYGDLVHDIKKFKLEASDDQETWHMGGSTSDVEAESNDWQILNGFTATGKYLRFTVTETWSGWQPWLKEISFTGYTGVSPKINLDESNIVESSDFNAGQGPENLLKTYGMWNPNPPPWYVIFDFQRDFTVESVELSVYGDVTHDVAEFTLETMHELSYEVVTRVTNVTEGTNQRQQFTFEPVTGRYWRFTVIKDHSQYQPWVNELIFHGY